MTFIVLSWCFFVTIIVLYINYICKLCSLTLINETLCLKGISIYIYAINVKATCTNHVVSPEAVRISVSLRKRAQDK